MESKNTILENFHDILNTLLESNNYYFNKTSYKHFNDRGLEIFTFEEYPNFSKYFPNGIPISVCKYYLSKMKVPDQNSSYVMAQAYPDKPEYVFNIPGEEGGGVANLMGGIRSFVDNMAATLSAIFFGYNATTVTLDNWMANYNQVWKEEFFLEHLPPKLKEEALLIKKNFFEYMDAQEEPYFVIGIRSETSLNKLLSSEPYRKNRLAALNPENGIKMIFISSKSIKELMIKKIPESDYVSYIDTGESYDTYKGMLALRVSPYKICRMLNDGGAKYSNQLADLNILSGQRITKMPWPGSEFIPEDIAEKHPESVLGRNGASEIDGSEIEKAIRIFSQPVPSQRHGLTEYVNVYLHEMDEKKIL
jgi:hypothetical protein